MSAHLTRRMLVQFGPRAAAACAALVLVACSPPAPEPDAGPNEPEETFTEVSFPDGFRFGTATAQWSAEGDESAAGPVASNWSTWAEMERTTLGQQNATGNGFYQKYEADIARAKELGLDTFRIAIDWSRVEPTPGAINEAELDHLVDVLTAIRAAEMEPVLTLWHWTVPLWVQNPDPAAVGGRIDLFADNDFAIVDAFEGFVRAVIPRVKGLVDTYTVLNEPFSMISAGYLGGEFPPGAFLNVESATNCGLNLVFMQARAFDVIKELDDEDATQDGIDSFVGLTMTANAFYPATEGNAQEEFAAGQISYVFNEWIPTALTTGAVDVDLNGRIDNDTTTPPEGTYDELIGRIEFIGVQYYGPVIVKDDPLLREFPPLYGRPVFDVDDYASDRPHSGSGREIRANGLRETLDIYAQFNLPILLSEGGTTTNQRPVFSTDDKDDPDRTLVELPRDEAQAAMYLIEHLYEVGLALNRGVDIRAYYHATLADGFEWNSGTLQRYGAYTVDFDDAERPRTLTLLGEALRDVVAAKKIDAAIWDAWVLPAYPSDQREQGGLTVSESPR